MSVAAYTDDMQKLTVVSWSWLVLAIWVGTLAVAPTAWAEDERAGGDRTTEIKQAIEVERERLIGEAQDRITEARREQRKVRRAVIKPEQSQEVDDRGRWVIYNSTAARDRELERLGRVIEGNQARIGTLRSPSWAPRLAAWDGEEAIGVGSWGLLEPTPHCRDRALDGSLLTTQRCDGPLRVFQVRGEVEALVECMASDITYQHSISGGRVVSRADSTVNERALMILVRGIPTGEMVDGQQIELGGVFEVTGTFTYSVPLDGPNTVYVVEPVEGLEDL